MIFNNGKILKRAMIALVMIIPMLYGGDYMPGAVVARLKRGIVELPQGQTEGNIESIKSNNNLRNLLGNVGLIKIEKVFPNFNIEDTLTQLENNEIVRVQDLSLVFKFSFSPDAEVMRIIDSLNYYSDVIYAEPDYIWEFYGLPDDPRFGEQWALRQGSDCDIDADQAWDIEFGNTGIKIGILDNGIEYTHPDLGSGFGPGYKIRGGWDYVYDDDIPEPSGNIMTHGTRVSGIASALTHNGYGIAGLSGGWSGSSNMGCQLFMFKIGFVEVNPDYAVQAIHEAARPTPSGYGIHVLNCSWGGEQYREPVREAISYAYKCGRTVCVSRGNAGDAGNPPEYPACYDSHWLISVGATNNIDHRPAWSSYGYGLDVVAPGEGILSTTLIDSGYFATEDGTSFAAPHVAGLAALIYSRALEKGIALQPEDVEGIIRATAEDKGPPGYDDEYGAGRINAYDALRYFIIENHSANILYIRKM